MAHKIFIDGEAGTTGLQIRSRLVGREDVELISLPDEARKDPAARTEALNGADLSILCLPEAASRDAVSMIENPDTRVIDASIAYRTDPAWVYGFAEYGPGQRQKIAAAKRVSNPGCYAFAAVAMVHPLVAAGLLPADFPVTVYGVSGYSGGGRKLIEAFENPDLENGIDSPFRLYALGLDHKHTEEIRVHGSLDARPLFVPSVGRFSQGMIVSLPLHLDAVPGSPGLKAVHGALADHYQGQRFVTVAGLDEAASTDHLDPEGLNGSNELGIFVFGNEKHGQALVCALLDNLGKGASGQAVQNMNLMLGLCEGAGLE